MNTEEQLLLRGGILKWLHGKYPNGKGYRSILLAMQMAGWDDVTGKDIQEALLYLERKNLIQRDTTTPEVRLYLISDDGRAWLDNRNLI